MDLHAGMLGVDRFHGTSLDAEFHLQAASQACFADIHILCD